MVRRSHLLLALALGLAACPGKDADQPVDTDTDDLPPGEPLVAGAPIAGAAEGTLKLPIGTPLAAFTSRCGCLGGTSKQDVRRSEYQTSFVASTGVHARPSIKAVWVTNGDKHLVMTKTDLGYAFDGILQMITERLEAATGEELDGQVTWSTNHSHSSYGTFSANEGFYLGSDRYNAENAERIVEQVVEVALQAYEARKPAALGFGVAKDWDPNDLVYSDRRGDNDDLVVYEEWGPNQGKKDPYLHLLKVDSADELDDDGNPKHIAVVYGWGMHPITFEEDSPLATGDATLMTEQEVAETFDYPMVAMFLQTGTGDASVRGDRFHHDWARTEAVGVLARDAILDLLETTPTSSDPILLETYGRSVKMNGDDVHVTRFGEVDWKYPKYDPAKAETHVPDQIIFREDGSIDPAFDEWYTGYGAVFCGSGDFDLPVGGLANVAEKLVNEDGSVTCVKPDGTLQPLPPGQSCEYATCMQVEFMKLLIETFFFEPGTVLDLPLDGFPETYVAASQLGPIPVRNADGTTGVDDVLLGFVPGEPLHLYEEMWRKHAKEQLGIEHTALFGYSNDHEGYLLIAEDWFRGGYEPDISIWGPLGGEWILESLVTMSKDVLGTDLGEPWNPKRGFWTYKEHPLPNHVPDVTPDAPVRLTNETLPPARSQNDEGGLWKFWVPKQDGHDRPFQVDLRIPDQMERVKGVVQIAWIGGDPGVDDHRITLERQDGDVWTPVTTPSGRVINDDLVDFAIGHTPDPLFPPEAQQTHYYWAVWQAVSHVRDRAGLPVGTYRLKVEGKKFAGGDTEFPWATEPYSFTTEPFLVVPAEIDVEPVEGGLNAWIQGPVDGYRLVDLEGHANGPIPLRDDLTVVWDVEGEGDVTETILASAPNGGKTFVAFPEGKTVYGATITDKYGNSGTWAPRL